MTAFFNYLKEFTVQFWKDFVQFFSDRVVSPWYRVPNNFKNYGALLNTYKAEFGGGGWTVFVIFWVLVAAIVGGLLYLLFRLIRKYVRFVKSELDKDKLREQVDELNYELYEAVQEKDKILNLKSAYLGAKPGEGKDKDMSGVRFPKLCNVDAQYKGLDTSIPPIKDMSLEELCNSFRNFAASKLKLYYTIDVIRDLFAGMATSKLIILEGISGTGKTSICYAIGKFFNFDSNIIPVQPSWKDRSDLIGYYNEFTKKFNETEFLRALYTATYRNEMNPIVLDEMNLSRVEYYFAEFLSIMEMKDPNEWKIDVIPTRLDMDPVNLKDGKLVIPQNVEFFGTANNDDSTFTISDKVYDRAIALFFNDKGRPFDAPETDSIHMPYSQMTQLYNRALAQYPISAAMKRKFEELDDYVIKNFKLAFGNRIMKQIDTFIPVYIGCGGTETGGYDFMFTNKVLKKFLNLNVSFLKKQLGDLKTFIDTLYGPGKMPQAQAYIDNLLAMN